MRRSVVLVLLIGAACGGRSVLDVSGEKVVVVESDASIVFVVADAAPSLVDAGAEDVVDASADAGSDAAPDVVDAGTGVCPEPPLLTGNGTPPPPSFVMQLALGNEHSCLLIDGQVWCWGKNRAGELGDGTQSSRARPTRVKSIANAVAIGSGPGFDIGCYAVRGSHTCALLNDATVRCWGSNVAGEVSWFVQNPEPIAIPGLAGVSKLGIGGYSNCAILSDGTASCWGTEAKPVPDFDGGLTDIAAGYGVWAVRKDGTVWTWGSQTSKAVTTLTPAVKVPQLSAITSVSAGWGHQCALRGDKTVWCWGSNAFGQVGDGTTTTNQATPVKVPGITDAVRIGTGSRVSCALLSDGTLKCWGDNTYGQLGLGTFGGSQSTPGVVSGLDKVTDIDGGLHHLCVRRTDMSVWCWGRNDDGQVGDGTTTNRASPVRVYPTL